MSLFDDDAGEMSRHRLINDRDAEAILTGSSPDAEFDELTHFLGRIKHVALRSEPTMSPALTALLSDLSSEKGDLSATAASNVHGPALQVAELPKRRSRMPIQFAAGLSLAAKFALGAGLAAAGATGAAAAGVLPGPVQHAAAAVVRTVTPFEVPDPTTSEAPDDTLETTTQVAAEDTTSSTTFGDRVSSDAKGTSDGTPGVDGATISSEAKAKHDDNRCSNVPTSTTVADQAGTDAAVTDEATTDEATDDQATGDDATEAGAADQPACKPADDEHGKPAAPGQNGLDTAASTPAAGHVPTSTPGGKGGNSANSSANHPAPSTPDHPSTPATSAVPATPATPAVPPSDEAPATSAVPAVPATPATAPSVPGPPAGAGTETPPSNPGSGHHS